MKRIISAVVLLVVLIEPAWAGFDEGMAAYNRGDYATALREWRALAEQGDANAQYNLGLMNYHGRGVPQDYTQAMRWYRKAAEQGNARAQSSLGSMHARGDGVPQDYVRAHMWFDLSASLDTAGTTHANAAKYRDIIIKRMTPARIAEAQRLAREWMAQFEARKK